jgi:hypothetical protein
MKPHTALVIEAAFSFDSCEAFTNLLRVPVKAYCTRTGESEGGGMADVAAGESEMVADTLQSLSDLVAIGVAPDPESGDNLRAWAADKVTALRPLLEAVEDAFRSEDDETLSAAVQELRNAALRLDTGIRGWEAAL